MKRVFYVIAGAILVCFFVGAMATTALALDPFMNYRNYSAGVSEDVAVTPDANFAVKQGYIYTNVLAANVAEVVTIPTGAKFFIINSTADLWVKVGGAATVPAADTTNDTGSELNPSARYLGSSTTIGIISESAAKVSIMFYE